MEPIIYLNGQWLKRSEARISVLDQGVLRGDGLFETIRIWKGKIPFIKEHLQRLYQGAEFADLKLPLERKAVENVLKDMVKKNHLQDGRLRLVITRGAGDSMDPLQSEKTETQPTFFVIAEGMPAKPSPEVYEKGVSIVTVPVFIYNRLFPVHIKTISYFHNMAAKRYAKQQGAFDAIFTDPEGFCTEGTTANLFWVKNKQVFSPPLTIGALPGVTRQTIVGILQRLGKNLCEEKIRRDDLSHVDEIFLSSSIVGILPVTRVDDKDLGQKIGPLTHKIRENFIAHVDELSMSAAD